MKLKTKICLVLIILLSLVGLYTAIHLAEIHYKKPHNQLTLINTLPFMGKFWDRQKIIDRIEKEKMSELKKDDPFSNPEFDPYASAANAYENVMTEEQAASTGVGSEACDISELISCSKVDESKYSSIGGIAVSLYGIAGYILLILLSAVCLILRRDPEKPGVDFPVLMLFGGCALGVCFSVWLTFLEAFVIHAYCPYCVWSAIVILLCLVAFIAGYGISPVKKLFNK